MIITLKLFINRDFLLLLLNYTNFTETNLHSEKREINDKDYNPNFNFIVSINEIDTDGKQDYDYSKYIDTVKENTRMYGIRRSAILTNTPKQVVGGVLYELAARELPMNFKIVSTLEAALTWVNLSIDYKSIVLENIELLAKAQPHTRHS